jgi:peptidoglycan/xylan/chitin deacetylase (PgdA/CDA1 family)
MSGRANRLATGILAIPISLMPFLAYGSWTPQGRHLVDQVRVTVARPSLPDLDPTMLAEVRATAPSYDGYVMPLVYHGVGSEIDGDGKFAVSPGRFGEQLAALRAAGMHFVTAGQVAAAFSGGPPLPHNAVLVTFDDGRSDAVLWATPLLEDADAVATMFVITDETESAGTYYASWGDLTGSGVWDLQSHTASLHHEQDAIGGPLPVLTSRAEHESIDAWRQRVRDDLDEADRAIAEETDRRPVAFAYPFGAWGGDRTNDPRIDVLLPALLAERYQLAFHQDGQDEIALAGPGSNRLGIRRLEVGDWSGSQLVRRIAAAARRAGV